MLFRSSPVDNLQVWKFLFPMVAKMDGEKAAFLVSCLGVSSRHAIPEPKYDITRTTRFKCPWTHFVENFFVHELFHSPYEGIVEYALDLIGEWEDFPGELNDCQKKMAVKLAECIPLEECEMHTRTTRQLVTFSEYWKDSSKLRKLELRLFDRNRLNVDIKALAQALHNNCLLTYLNVNFYLNGDEIAVALSEALESNTTLTHLGVLGDYDSGDAIGQVGASALARALKKNKTLKRLVLASIKDQGVVILADALQTNSTLAQLGIANYGIVNYLRMEAICKALQFNHVITHLDLRAFTITDSEAEAMAGALQSPATQLSHLNLAVCKITSLGVESLAGAFKINRSLTHLSLQYSDLSHSATALAETLRLNRTLTHLDLSQCKIDDLGTEVICKALQFNHVITHLFLGGNTIGDSGAVALAEALKSPATQLSYLELYRCHITTFGVEILAGALQTNRSLTHLNLAGLSISSSATALAEALQLNRTLTHLDLSHNQISDTEAIQLAQTLLDKNNTLAHLGLFDNNINAEGKAKLELVSEKRCFIRF